MRKKMLLFIPISLALVLSFSGAAFAQLGGGPIMSMLRASLTMWKGDKCRIFYPVRDADRPLVRVSHIFMPICSQK